jgi:3-oxoacyl-[acyl-carrier-protein] synthase-1
MAESTELRDVPAEVSRILELAGTLAGWNGDLSVRNVATSGNSGTAESIIAALRDLEDGIVQVAVVGGADTLLAEDTLWWLQNTGRLKTPAFATGLEPGEAAVFFVLGLPARGAPRSESPLARILGVWLAKESHSRLSGKPPRGDGIANLLEEMADVAGWKPGTLSWVISDQNGEVYPAQEWGCAQVRLRPSSPHLSEPALWYPARAFGETGTVSGAVGLALAVRAYQRNYAPSRSAGILSSDLASSRAAILVGAPEAGR